MGSQRVRHDWASELNWLILFQVLCRFRHWSWVVLTCLEIRAVAVRSSLAVPMNDWLPETLLPPSPLTWPCGTNTPAEIGLRRWMWPVSSTQEVCGNGEANRNLSRKTISNQIYFYLSIPFIKILQNCCHIKRQSKSTQPKTTDKNGTGVSGSDLIETIILFFWIFLCFVIFVSF